MDFSSVMQNLAIGIASGIFSSIIVSVVFYLLSEFQNELAKANDMIYPLYGVVLFGKPVKIYEEELEKKLVSKYFSEAVSNFERFEPWRFKYGLHEPMCKINNIIMDGKYSDENMNLYPEMIEEFSCNIECQLESIRKCEKDFAKEFVKRIFRNKIIIITIIIFVIILLIA